MKPTLGFLTPDLLTYAFAIGLLATAFMDLWALVRKRLFNIPLLDFALVGRWLGHMCKGQFFHASIGLSPPVRGEALIGWTAHYGIGIVFAVVFTSITGENWRLSPTIWPAILFGAATVAAPYFILQPAMGAGIAACKTPKPNIARLRSLVSHLAFGVGLYLAGLLMRAIMI